MHATLVQETTTAPGNAAVINLNGPAPGRRGFVAAFGSGASVFYVMDDGVRAEWGIGTVNSGSPQTLTRPATVIGNTDGTAARLTFPGPTRVYCAPPAESFGYLALPEQTVTTPVGAVDFAIPAAAKTVQFEIQNAQPVSSSASLSFRVSTDGGSTYLATNIYTPQGGQLLASYAPAYGSAIDAFAVTAPILNTAFAKGVVEIDLTAPYYVLFRTFGLQTGPVRTPIFGGGTIGISARITNVRWLMSASSNINAGTFRPLVRF